MTYASKTVLGMFCKEISMQVKEVWYHIKNQYYPAQHCSLTKLQLN